MFFDVLRLPVIVILGGTFEVEATGSLSMTPTTRDAQIPSRIRHSLVDHLRHMMVGRGLLPFGFALIFISFENAKSFASRVRTAFACTTEQAPEPF